MTKEGGRSSLLSDSKPAGANRAGGSWKRAELPDEFLPTQNELDLLSLRATPLADFYARLERLFACGTLVTRVQLDCPFVSVFVINMFDSEHPLEILY